MYNYYSGIGFDIHRLIEGRALIIGGHNIPFDKGLLGHSDGDVLFHALADAILGVINEGDIGELFPDDEETYRDIDSSIILKKAIDMAEDKGFNIYHTDIIIYAERPKLLNYKKAIISNIKNIMNGISVNIKAKTMEGLGSIGKGEAIGCSCIVNAMVNNN